jgi:hypothetical protein
MGKNQHITYKNGLWNVIGAGNSKPTKTFNNKNTAIDYGRKIATNQQSNIIIHKMDGKIQDSDSYGKDPCPPKDKVH